MKLTERERAILTGILAGKTYAHIAKDLGVPYDTLNSQTDRLRDKLGIRKKVALALWAARHLRNGKG